MATTKITPDQVQSLMNAGQRVGFVDTRSAKAWDASDVKAPAAIRLPADEVDQRLDEIPRDATVVVYCT